MLHVTINALTKQDYANVMTELFTTKKYNKNVLPVEYANEPVNIDISLSFLGINEIDEVAEKFVTTGSLITSWKDTGLAWNETEHNTLSTIFVPQNDIWKPDVVLLNGFIKFEELGGSYYYIQVNSKGITKWMPFEVFESRCSLDTKYYPFDSQICSLVFTIWSFTSKEVRIENSTEGVLKNVAVGSHGV